MLAGLDGRTKVLDFAHAKAAVARQWDAMQRVGPIFRTAATGEELWAEYLRAFPAGTNPIFRERTEHDCSCCRHFVRDVGNAVALVPGPAGPKVISVWDCEVPEEPAYAAVFARLSRLAKERPIADAFLHPEATAGTDRSRELRDGSVHTWNHFFVGINPALRCKAADIAANLGERRATKEVFARGMLELTLDSVDTVLEMVGQNSLYRGEEHRGALEKFRALKVASEALPPGARDLFAWYQSGENAPSVCRIRNTAVGSLLVDLSEGRDLEDSVKSFEQKVAPANYRRPTAIVTKAMVERARAAVAELGLTSALERRHAVVEDLRVDDLLFVDRGTRAAINGDAFDAAAGEADARPSRVRSDVDEVPLDRFLAEVLPRCESLEVLFESRHAPNLVTLLTAADPASRLLFKWPNHFSWSYAGEVADSIKERVKAAGGSVTGEVCCRLAWHNYDDLDLHMLEPRGGHVFFGNRRSPSGGWLDVDMNAGGGRSREPVENIAYPTIADMPPGTYTLYVNNYNLRERKDAGFEVEIDVLGEVHSFAMSISPTMGGNIEVARIEVGRSARTREPVVAVVPMLPAEKGLRGLGPSKRVWGIDTNRFHRVKAAMLSPNCWGADAVGNRHLFLMLEGCASDAPARGFYNEFLLPGLDQHRKVLEVVGSKAAVQPSDRQLSGLGFSSTQRNSLVCRAKGSHQRTMKIVF